MKTQRTNGIKQQSRMQTQNRQLKQACSRISGLIKRVSQRQSVRFWLLGPLADKMAAPPSATRWEKDKKPCGAFFRKERSDQSQAIARQRPHVQLCPHARSPDETLRLSSETLQRQTTNKNEPRRKITEKPLKSAEKQ